LGKLTSTPYLVLFVLLGALGVGTASALMTITLSGNVIITGDTELEGKLLDSNDDAGTAGQVLSSTETGIDWVDPTPGPRGATGMTGMTGVTSLPPITIRVGIPSGSGAPGCEDTNSCFIPFIVLVLRGDTVIWTNDDTVSHTVTSGSAAEGLDGNFDSSLILAGTTFSHEFTQNGTFPYFCLIHPWMTGEVLVI